MSTVAKKIIAASGAGGGGGISGQFTKGLIMGTSDATAIDVEDVSSMSFKDNLAGSEFSIAQGSAVDTSRDYAFFANSIRDEITLVDFSDINNVVIKDSLTDSIKLDSTRGVDVDSANEVVFATSLLDDFINAIDYSTPTAMSFISSLDLGRSVTDVKLDVARDVAYVQSSGKCFCVDISNTSSMSILQSASSSTIWNNSGGIVLDTTNDYQFAANPTKDWVIVLNTANTASIAYISLVASSTNLDGASKLAIDVSKNLVFCLGAEVLSVIDYSTISSMTIEDTVTNTAFGTGTNRSLAVDTARELIFVAARSETPNVYVYDYSDPTNLTLAATISGSTSTTNGGQVVLSSPAS
jgi:phage anti-repressor protein